MIPTPKKISELSPIPSLSNLDLLVFVDTSDTSSSPQGTTKKGSFGQIKENILNSISLPKATNQSAGAVVVGSGLSIDSNGTLSSNFSGSYSDLTNKPSLVSNLSDLLDTRLVTVTQGQSLFYELSPEGSKWVNRQIRYSDLTNIPVDIVKENSSANLQNLSISGNLIVTGTTISNNFETLNVGTSEIVLNDQLGKFVGDATAGSAIISGVNNAFSLPNNIDIQIASNGGPLTLPPGTKIQSIISPTQVQLTNQFQGNGSANDITFKISIQPQSNAAVIVNRSAENNSQIRWNELNNIWEFTNNGTNFYPLPLPSAYGDYQTLSNKPSIPGVLTDLSDVSDTPPDSQNPFLRWTGIRYAPSSIQAVDLSGLSINALNDVNTSNPPTLGQVLKWNGDAWSPSSDLVGGLTTEGAIVTPGETSSIIPFYHETFDAFPDPSVYEGSVAYTKEGGTLHYAHSNQWLELALASDVQPNTDTTYSIGVSNPGGQVPNQRAINLLSSIGQDGNSSITVSGGGGLTVTNSGNVLVLTSQTYSLSVNAGVGADDVKLTLNGATNNNITLQGADGLSVERQDANTIILRAPSASVTQYTDTMAKDAVGAAILAGTHVGITFTYDSVNKQINSIVSGGGGGGGGTVILYDLGVTNTTTNQAIVSLTPSSGTADTFEIVGGNGTTVSWDNVESKITISSTAPVNADWNATSGLARILNKPTIPAQYTLPAASSSVLGGIKVGNNLQISPDGTLSAIAGGYTLPQATSNVLGGIKIGAGLSIDENGIVTVAQGEGGVPLQTRLNITQTTGLLNPNAYQEIVFENGYKTYSLLKLSSTQDAWIRIYTDQASMVADRNRSEGNDPLPGSGVIAEVRTSGTQIFTPVPIGFNNDSPVSNKIYVSVTNRTLSSSSIGVTLTILRLEA